MKSFFKKILYGYVAIILLYSVFLFIIVNNYLKNKILQIYISNLKDTCYSISLPITEFFLTKNYSKLNEFINNLKNNLQIITTIVSPDGMVLFDSHYDKTKMENHSNRAEIIDAKTKGFGYSVRYSSTLRKEMLYVAIPLKDKNDNTFAILRTSYSIDELYKSINEFIYRILTITFFVCILVLLFSVFLSSYFTKPIEKLINSIKKLSNIELNKKTSFSTTDEFSFLEGSFNEMVEKIGILLSDISFQRDKLKNIFNSLQEAVVLINKEGKIVLYNKSFEKLCKITPIEDKLYCEVMLSYKFDEIIKKAFSEKKNLTEELNIEEKTYLVSCSDVSEEELIVLLYDITSYKQLQKVKKEFVSDIVHELKTPLTSIKGFLETLYEEINEPQQKRFVEIAIFNTNRLINIVNDLVTLSYLEKLEEEKNFSEIKFEDININAVLNDIKDLFETKAKQKNLDFIIDVKTELKPIKADRFKIEQVVTNLVDNAIKYTEKGYVKIKVEQDQFETKIIVEDTGIGIPKEYHERIFERFFVVDKARSKKTGGTGLGLAIVKHIVNLHRGKIFVESSPNSGSKFIVILPNTPKIS
jgi:two-component system phosphate regulon sensor histidine kinase PhoR